MILITESRLTDDISDNEISLNNYKIYRCDSTSRHTGGSAIYVRDDVAVLNTNKIIIEKNMWLIQLKIKNASYNGIIAAIYHSPNANHNEFISAFNEWCSDINEENENMIICKSKSDVDKVTPTILKDSMSIIGQTYCDIINDLFEKGIFPNWKCSIVKPIEKVNGTINPHEFRPINSMPRPTYEKVIEIIVKKQLDKFMNINNILTKNESGYRLLHSCETSLNYVIENWNNELDKNNACF